MTSALRLRDDLVFRPQTGGLDRGVVVKDPATQRFFRIGEIEHFVALQLDGVTPLDDIRRRVEERFGRPLSEQTLTQLIEQFRRFRLLDEDGLREQHQSQRWGGSLLYIRMKAFDPDRFLEWLVPHVTLVFTRQFLIASAFITATAFALTLTGWSAIVRDLSRLYRFDALLLAWITVLVATTGHELAHGVTCKRFGGQVNEIGFMLIYFQPAFYCNVSDAWMIPEKAKRLWVSFAGAYFDILVWSLATLIWRVAETDTWISFLALVMMATSGIKTVFNLNPLIKLDGYYLLSDYLEIPNLRQKSLAALKGRFRDLRRWSPKAIQVRSREQRIHLAYGALAAIYSTWLITVVVSRLGDFLVDRFRGAGLIAFIGILAVAFQRPLGHLVSKAAPRAEKPVAAAPGNRRRWRLIALALVSAIVGVIPSELKVPGDFRILPAHNAEVRAQVEGILVDIYKDEGDRVAQGDAIARLDDRAFRSELQKVDAQIAEAQARRDLLQAGPRREEIDLARAERDTARVRREHGEKTLQDAGFIRAAEIAKVQTTVEKAEQRLRFSRNDLARLQRLFASALVARQTVDEAEQDVAVRQKELEEAQAAAKMVTSDNTADARKERDVTAQELSRAEGQLRVLMAGSRPEQVAAIDAEISRLRAERAYLEQQVQLAKVDSPAAGVIATPKLKDRRGERVNRGDLIAKVYEQSVVTAEIRVPEKEIADVAVGQSVVVKARAFPNRTFTSRITAIAPVAIEDDRGFGGRVIRVMTDIDNRSGLLKSEMTGNAKIYCGSRRIFELITRRMTRYVRVEFWSWW